MAKIFSITQYPFDQQLEFTLLSQQREYLTWPVVYFLQNNLQKEAYVGETTDMVSRMKTHLKTPKKQSLSTVSLIKSELFNKSATLDIEANLIRYIAADGEFTLQNGNLGISNHHFYQQKEVYWKLFKDIWADLQSKGIARHSLEYIDNSDLFKYSPYKSLSREQNKGLKTILECLLDPQAKVSLIHGGAGTGKSILAIFLFKLLKTNLSDFNRADFEEEDEELFLLVEKVREQYKDLAMGLVIPMQSFRKTIANVFRNIKGLSPKMVIGPAEVAKSRFDLLIVDEGHRLRQWRNLAAYYGTFRKVSQRLGLDELSSSELDWILMQSDKTVIFYDESQSIKPSDTDKQAFAKLQDAPFTRTERLQSQFRVRGGEYYVDYIYKLFSDKNTLPRGRFKSVAYDFRLFTDLKQMLELVKRKNRQVGLSRMVAGFAWDWISKKNKSLKDIIIGDVELSWNSTDVDWVNSSNAINEVGCIHTTQGYDLNYTGVIIGPELDYDFDSSSFIVYKDRYKDKNGKNTINDPLVLKNYVLNIYRTILFRGIQGTYIYACNPNLQKYLAQFVVHGDYPNRNKPLTIYSDVAPNRIPYYDLTVSADNCSELQQAEHMFYIELEDVEASSDQYFACRVIGESVDKIIRNGSICLFEKYTDQSKNGLICLIAIQNYIDRDFGTHYTIKEYSSKKTFSEDEGELQEVTLLPRSRDAGYSPLVFRDEEIMELKVVGVFVKVLQE